MHRDMGLYDDRLADLSESRRPRRVSQRRLSTPPKPMEVQSLLFDRSAGWTESKAKAWAQSHGYKYGKVDVTDQYVRIRQFDPKGSTVKRTIPFGRGIRAVVAKEHSMRTSTVKSPRRRRAKKSARKSAKRAPVKRARRRARKVAVAAPKRRRRAKKTTARKTHRRSRRVKSHVMEASKRRRRVKRRRPSHKAEAWKGDSAGHAKAARKGHKRSKARKSAKRGRRRVKRVRETAVAAPKRRRHSRRRKSATVMESPRKRRRHHRVSASRGGSSGGMSMGALALMVGTGGVGFILADGLDRLLATYNPSSTDAKPTDKFVSDGSGTAANVLNVAAMPNWKRAAASVGLTAAPAVGAMFVKNSYGRAALEGLAVGAGVNMVKLLWSNVVMPMLIGKDTTDPTLRTSYIARLYPAEVAAHISLAAKKGADGKTAPGPYPAAGVLSGPAQDVGPFALGGDSPYEDAATALRKQAGMGGDSPYDSAADALRKQAGMGGDSPYESQADSLRKQAGMGYQPGPPPGQGPGPQVEPPCAECGVSGVPKFNRYTGFVGDDPVEDGASA